MPGATPAPATAPSPSGGGLTWGGGAPVAPTPAAAPASTGGLTWGGATSGAAASSTAPASTGGLTWGKTATAPIVAPAKATTGGLTTPFSGALQGPKGPIMPTAQPFSTPTSKMTAAQAPAFTMPTPIMGQGGIGDVSTPAPTLTQQIGGDVSDIINTPTAKVPVTAQSYLADIYNANPTTGIAGAPGNGGIVGNAIQAWQKVVTDFQSMPSNAPGASKAANLAAVGKAGADAIGAFFSPLSTVFSEVAKVPGPIGNLGDIVNKAFGAISAVGGDTLADAVQTAPPSVLSQSQKDTLSPVAHQIGGLIAQIIAGKAGDDVFTELKTSTTSFVNKLFEDGRLQDLNNNPAIQAAIAKVSAPQPVPIEKAETTGAFSKTKASGQTSNSLNSMTATDMPPVYRQELRDSLKQNGPAVTKVALQQHFPDMTDEQAGAHMREAPRPQNDAERATEAAAIQAQIQKQLGAQNDAKDAAAKQAAQIKEQNDAPKLLNSPTGPHPVQGEGFTMSEKPDAQKVAINKATNKYHDVFEKYNKNPSPERLAAVLKARDEMKASHETPVPKAKVKNQSSKDLTGTPSSSISTKVDTGTDTSLPSLSEKTAVGRDPGDSRSTRYTSPSNLKNEEDIPTYITKSIEHSQANEQPFTEDIQKATGTKPEVRIKSKESAEGKITRLAGRGKPFSAMDDVLAGRIVVKPEDVNAKIDAIKKQFKVTQIADHRIRESPTGYFGVNIKVELPNGTPAEIQIHTPESLGHSLETHSTYERWRNTPPTNEAENTQFKSDMQKSKDMAEAAAQREGKYTGPNRTELNPQRTVKPVKDIPGISRVGKSVEAKAIEGNLTKGLDSTAEYDIKPFREAAAKTADLINSGIDNARAVVRGESPRPDGVTTGSLIAGMEEYAKQNPKEAPEIMEELANSKIASETSAHAQELGSLRMREPDSATAKLTEIKNKMIERAGGANKVAKAKADIVKNAKDVMKKVNLPKADVQWNKFLDSITC